MTVLGLHPNRPALVGLLDSCPAPTCTGPAGHLSLKRSRGEAAAHLGFESLYPWFRLRPRCAELTHAETAALRRLLPAPAEAGGTAVVLPSWAIDLAAGDPAATVAELEVIAQEHPPPAATPRSRRTAEGLNVGFLLAGVAVGFALLAAATLVDDGSPALAGALVALALAAWVVLLAFAFRDRNFAGDRYLLRRLRTRLAARGDRLLAADDPDVLAVAMVPRSVWSEPNGNQQIDHGLIAVRGGTVLYEGDRLRLRAPAASLLHVGLDRLVVDQHATWHFVVVVVRGPHGRHELPLVRIGCPLAETLLRSHRKRSMPVFEQLSPLLAVDAEQLPLG
jgi:hypothetical protein